MGVVESQQEASHDVPATKTTVEYLAEEDGRAVVNQDGSLLSNVKYEYISVCADTVTMLSDYKLGALIGQGTSGHVNVATHVVTNEKVAVKIISKKDSRRELPMPKEELRCLKSLRHDNIVRLLSVVDTSKSLYLVMEYCDTDMLSFLNSCPVWLTEMTAARFFAQALAGVQFCHSLGVCHRDLKLENLLLSGTTIKIADFGLSKFVDLSNQLESYAGSPQYLAPELVEESQAFDGTAADMWSSGVVMYALLFRGLPFDGDNLEIILHNIQRGKYTLTRPVSAEAAHLLSMLLHSDPSLRITAASALENAWILAHQHGPADQQLPDLPWTSKLPVGTSMVDAGKAVSTDTMLSNVTKRLELKRKAEAAGIRMPSIPSALPPRQKRTQDDSFHNEFRRTTLKVS